MDLVQFAVFYVRDMSSTTDIPMKQHGTFSHHLCT